MWQKLVAGACVMTGAVGFGLSMCGELNSEIAHLKKLKELLNYIVGEIAYLRRPAAEILSIAAERMGEPYAEFLERTSVQLDGRNGRALSDIWRSNIAFIGENKMPREALFYMERMGECFGLEADKMQIESFKLFERGIDERIEELCERRKEDARLINALSALAGVLCIVLFL